MAATNWADVCDGEVHSSQALLAELSAQVPPAACVQPVWMVPVAFALLPQQRFVSSQWGVELRLEFGNFLITESALMQKEMETSCKPRKHTNQLFAAHVEAYGKQQLKLARELRFMEVVMALHQCSDQQLAEIIDEAFSQQRLATMWDDAAGNYFAQHLIKIAKAEQLEIFCKFLLDNFDKLLKKKTAYAGRYVERLAERTDFANLLNTTTHVRTLVERIGTNAACWAKHRDANFALGVLLETAPKWFLYLAQRDLLSHKIARENGVKVLSQMKICLEKAESREWELRDAAHGLGRLRSTLRRSWSCSDL